MDELARIERDALARVAAARDAAALAAVRTEYLGRRGALAGALRAVGALPAAERPAAGARVHAARERIAAAVAGAAAASEVAPGGPAPLCDVTLPGRRVVAGAAHPLRRTEAAIVAALTPLGFTVADGPQVEHDWYNFEALNIPADHPARDMQDTFFLAPQVVLRTHTSNVQVRTMVRQPPPVRILTAGMVYRHDEVDATHTPAFHQLEGLWVDERASFADLRGVLRHLVAQLFGAGARTRFRPSFFPFTEPSAEVDVSCVACDAAHRAACRVCRGTGWLEILGAGMVDPAVLTAVGYDPDRVQGFAFGIGIERVAMLRHGIDDIRLLFDNDIRFLRGLTGPTP